MLFNNLSLPHFLQHTKRDLLEKTGVSFLMGDLGTGYWTPTAADIREVPFRDDQERLVKMGDFSLLASSFHCFDTVGWITAMESGL